MYASGGNPGAGTNSAVGLLAVLGQCPTGGSLAAAVPFVFINEVSTIAAAYAFAGFATDATHVSSSGTALAQVGIANAFANAANLVSISTGTALTKTPGSTSNGQGIVPSGTINALANILSYCVNSSGTSTNCATLFSYAKNGATTPTDTATAAINIAHNPGGNVVALFNLVPSSPPFQLTLGDAPSDWMLAITFQADSLYSTVGALYAIAIDGYGNAWAANGANSSITKLSPAGVVLSGTSGYTGGGLNYPRSIAIDSAGDAWIANAEGNSVVELSNSGAVLSGTSGFAVGNSPSGIAIDGSGAVWTTNFFGNSTTELSGATGSILGTFSGGSQNDPFGVAVDTLGNVWVADYGGTNVTKIGSGGAATSYSSGQYSPFGVAIDALGSVWVSNYASNSLTKLSGSGGTVAKYTGGGLDYPASLAIDGTGNVWVPNAASSYGPMPLGSLSEFSNSGAAVSPAGGFGGYYADDPQAAAIDGSGNIWVCDYYFVVLEFIGAATPVVTPLATAVKMNMLGTRP